MTRLELEDSIRAAIGRLDHAIIFSEGKAERIEEAIEILWPLAAIAREQELNGNKEDNK